MLTPPGKILVRHQYIHATFFYAHSNLVAIPYYSERPPDCGFGRDVQDHGSKRGAAHARIGNPHHVLEARTGELGGDGQVSGLRHAGSNRAGVLQHKHIILAYVQQGVVDTRSEVIQIGEHDGAPLVFKQLLVGRRAFQDGPIGGEVAEQRQ